MEPVRPIAILAVALTLFVPAAGFAQPADPGAAPVAVTGPVTFEEGRAAFRAGRFDDAAPILRAAADAETQDLLTKRDALHLLGHTHLAREAWGAAITAFEQALEIGTGKRVPSSLADVMRFGLARALVANGRYDRAHHLLRRVDRDPQSALHESALMLRARAYELSNNGGYARRIYEQLLDRYPDAPARREWSVRLATLELAARKRRAAIERLHVVVDEAPDSRAGTEAALRLEQLAAAGVRSAKRDAEPSLNRLKALVGDRRYGEAEPYLLTRLEHARDRGLRRQERQVMTLLLPTYHETRRYRRALEVHDWLDDHEVVDEDGERVGLSDYKRSRALAFLGDFKAAQKIYLKRYHYNRGRSYYTAIGDLHYEFGQYADAYTAYEKAQTVRLRRRSKKPAPTERMVWCKLRTGDAAPALAAWESKGRSRSTNKSRLKARYWYGRALEIADRADDAKIVFSHLVEDAPYDYYGIQAWSRLAEHNGDAIADADGNARAASTVAWSAVALAGAFDQAPTRASIYDAGAALRRFAGEHDETVPEALRAWELVRLGFVDDAVKELRVVDMDLRRLSRGGASAVQNIGRADLLDNRRTKKVRGGAKLTRTGRKSRTQARAFKRKRSAIRDALRTAQKALAEVYGVRRDVYEQGRMTSTPDESGVWRDVYPIAWPALVSTFAKQFDVPPYFVYGIMAVESAFHPHPVSVADAYGLLQVIPRTGRRLSLELGFTEFSPELLLEPAMSIYFGTYYLGTVLKKFKGQEMLAAAAYNGGPHRVAAWLTARGRGPMDMFVEEIPFNQARKYAKSVIKNLARYRATYHDEPHTYVSNALDPVHLDEPNY